MVTAPTVPNLQVDNFKVNDRRQAVIKDNSRNKKMELFATQLAKMCDELNIEFQYVEDTRIDITSKSGQVAADRQAVTAAKNAVNADRQHVDQQKQAIDTTAGQVSENAQQVATDRGVVAKDKQSAANAARAASRSADDALTAKQQAEALYGDLDAVNTAKTQSQQAAQTATQQAGQASTARQAAESAQDAAETAAQEANVDVDAAINAVVNGAPSTLNTLNKLAAAIANNPSFHTDVDNALADKLSTSGGVLTGDLIIDKSGTRHLWFRENGATRGLLYVQSFGNDFGTRLRTYLENGNVAADLGLKENGDIEAIAGRFKGDGSGLTGTAPIRATGTTKADVGLHAVDNYSRDHYDARYVQADGGGQNINAALSVQSVLNVLGSGNTHLYFKDPAAGGENALIYHNPTIKKMFMRLRNGTGNTQAQLTLAENGDIASEVGRFAGDGSGLTNVDAAKLNGEASSEDDNPYTIARRTRGGDLFARLFKSSYAITNSDIAAIYTTRTVGGDWMRPSTPDQVRDALGGNPGTVHGGSKNAINGTNHTHAVASTASRDSSSTNSLLVAKAMYDHKRSSDHDSRYYTKSEVDSTVNQGVIVKPGEVGSYSTFYVPNGTPLGRGTIVSGSTLTWAGLNGAPSTDVPSGSWRLMSHSLPSSDADRANKTAIFQRVNE